MPSRAPPALWGTVQIRLVQLWLTLASFSGHEGPIRNARDFWTEWAIYFFGGLIMMWAPAVPGYMSHGALSLGLVDSPVDSGVAKGT